MRDFGLVLLLTLLGPLFLLMGIASLRRGWWRESIPLAEALLDGAAGIQPPPRTAGDRRFNLFQAVASIVLGSFFTLCLAAVLISLFSE